MARRAERVARAGGSFLGGIANNPGIVIIGLVLGGLFIFKDKISEAFASVGEGFGNIDIQLPEIKLPEITFPDFPKFPDITFPDFTSIFSGFQKQIEDISGQVFDLQGALGAFGADTTITKEGVIEGSPPTIDLKTGDDLSTLFGELRPKVFDTLINLGFEPAEAFGFLKNVTTIEGLNQVLQSVNSFGQISMIDIEEPPGQQPVVQPSVIDQPVSSFLTDSIQKFLGGGVGFVGGSIFETPIENLSLSQIIDKFGVTASQAANILATAKDDFGDFDFGTNIGGLNLPGLSGLNVSDPQFQGLTAEQIALQLTGGNIQNF